MSNLHWSRITSALAAVVLVLFSAGRAKADLLLESQVQLGEAIVYQDHDPNSGKCYYLPAHPKLSTWPDGTPKLFFAKYTKTGSEIKGGILHFIVRLGLDASEVDNLKSQITGGRYRVPYNSIRLMRAAKIGQGAGTPGTGLNCKTLGPVIFKKGEFMVVSAVAGEGGVFTRKIVGTGSAPLIAGSEAAVSIAVTQEGATFLQKALDSATFPVDVAFNMTYEGLTPQYHATATINWDKVRQYFEQESKYPIYQKWEADFLGIWHWEYYVRVGDRQDTKISDFMRSNGMIDVQVTGQDDNMDALLTTLVNQVMKDMTEATLDLPQSQSEQELEASKGEDGKGGGSADMPYGTRTKTKTVQRSGSMTINLVKRLRQDRDTGPLTSSLGGPLRQFKNDPRVYMLVDLDDPNFQDRTISSTLDIEDADKFGSYINYVTVSLKKKHPDGSTTTGDIIFNRKSFQDSGNTLTWIYPRLTETSDSWLTYQYKVTWSFAGGAKMEYDWQDNSAPIFSLAPPHKFRTIDLMADSGNVDEKGIRYISVKLKNRVLGKDREREVKVVPSESLNAKYNYFHEENDFNISYKITWYLKSGGKVEGNWQATDDSFIDLNLNQ